MSQYGPQDHLSGSHPGGPQYHPSAPPHGGPVAPADPSDRSMAVLAHLSTLIGALLTGGWLVILGPLVMWLVYKDRSPFVRQASAGAFNFAIWVNVVSIIGWVLTLTLIGAVVGIPMLIGAAVVSILFPILGAVAANRGERYGYPLTPAFIR